MVSCFGEAIYQRQTHSLGMQVDSQCTLRLREDESHPHLSFSCSSALQVWSSNLFCNGISNGSVDLEGLWLWTKQHRGGGSMSDSVFKLSLEAVIYWPWRERNDRTFRCWCKDCSSLQNLIILDDIRECINSWRRIRAST